MTGRESYEEEREPIYVSRRKLIHGAVGLALGATMLEPLIKAATASAGNDAFLRMSEAQASETLNILTWETYDNAPWLAAFKKKTGITVKATSVGSPAEMFAKVRANPGQYDIVYATSGWFDQYVKSKLLIPVDEKQVKNIKRLKLGFDWRAATSVGGKNYAILYNWGDQPLGWLAQYVPGKYKLSKYMHNGTLDDWNVLWDPQFKGLVSIFDDPTSVEPMIPLALGFKNPYKLNEAQFKAFEKKLMALRPQVKRLTSGFDDQTNQFASGEAIIGYVNNVASTVALAKKGKKFVINNIVKQGTPAWSDNMAITAKGGAKKLDAVYAFINESISIPWQARFIATSGNSGTLNYEQATSPAARRAGLTKRQLAATLIPATRDGKEFFDKMLFFQSVEDLQRRIDVWNKFKLGIG